VVGALIVVGIGEDYVVAWSGWRWGVALVRFSCCHVLSIITEVHNYVINFYSLSATLTRRMDEQYPFFAIISPWV